ncbi:hypothetical protein NCS57_00635400 [Fusarium keratoplasticum]|uniref:Uncharacterized protein n=1 Tax=Fusarium keratoplasticum TaxID=1328300 RepID=A0ACC0R534_9HYPO|nr:hypothetical protein NCS57_00635400 [Fusarium keratoplasticum]KAI8671596.1 hypothetical protein NCS57_00635400 [Fusarium keratoplasticum]
MPSQSQYVDSKFLFPHTYREGNKCIGWTKSRRYCNNPISQGKHLRHLLLMEQLNELSLAEQITSPLLEQAVELRLCYKHLENHLAPELEKAQRKLMIALDDSERQGAAQYQPARTRTRLPENTAPVSRPEVPSVPPRSPTTRIPTAHIPAARTPRVRFTSSARRPAGEPSAAYAPSPRPATARRATPVPSPVARPPAVNDYISPAYAPGIRPQQIRVAEARIPPTGPLPPHPAIRFWEPASEYGNQLGGQSHPWARIEPLTPPTSLPSPRDDTHDSDVTVGRSMNSTAATIYIPSDSEVESASNDDDDDDSSEDEGPADANSRVYPMGFWHRYDKKWDSLEDNGRVIGKALEEQIPWPVYGNSYPTPENVEAFYHDAVIGFTARSDRILVMGNECRRWAPKNLKKVLGKRIFKGMFAETLQMIYSVARSCHDRLISEAGGN